MALLINMIDRLDLGIQGENLARTISIDCNAWKQLYPNGTISIYHQRHGEDVTGVTGASYNAETGILTWSPLSYDTYYEGAGKAVIRLTDGNIVKKSKDVVTIVEKSVTNEAGTAISSNWQAYIDEIERLKDAAEDAMEGSETAQDAAEDAAEDAQDAQAAAETAQGKAEDAQEAAETAQGKAEDAQEAAEAAQTAAETAQGKAEDAQEAAEAAQTAAETAQGKAEDAQEAAETAQGKAEDAQEAAESAQTAAETAQGLAEDAQEAAEDVLEDIQENYGQMSSDITALKTAIASSAIPNSVNTGKYINANGGLSNDASYDACDFIDISKFTSVSFSTSLNSARGFAFYKSDQITTTLVVNGNNCTQYGYTASSVPQIVEFTVPSESKYLRFTRRNTYDVTPSAFIVNGTSYGGLAYRVSKIENDVSDLSDVAIIANNALTEAETNTDTREMSFTWVDGYYIKSDGAEYASASYSCTDFIYIGGLKHITFPLFVPDGSAGMCVAYDAQKRKTQLVQNLADPSGTIREFTFTDNDKYVRFSCYGTRKSQFYVIADKIAESIAKTCRLALGEYDKPDSNLIYDGGMTRIFNRIGVIGDSLSSGEMAYGDAQDESTIHYVDMYQYSWIQYLARSCGTTAYNFSQGGMNTRNFLADLGGHLTDLRKTDYKCQAYFVALCHNDDNYGVPIGSPSDINTTDPTLSADTFYGNYAHIISEIKSVEPNAKIFCVCSKVSSLAPYNVAIRYMATIFTNVYILDFENYFPELETVWEYTQGHGNAMGYLNYSWQIGTYVDYIIRNNRNAFKYVQFIGTEYGQYIPS